MEYFRLPSDHTGLARPNPRGGLEIPGTVNFLKYHLAQRFHILTAHFEIRVITLYVTGMKIVELARTGSNGGSSRKSAQEKSCSLPIIYLLLLFLSSICIKYLNWEIPNVHNLQQASNPGIIIVWIPRILSTKFVGVTKSCWILGLNITHGYVMANIITSKSGNIKQDLRHHAEVLETAMSSKISSPWLEAYKSEKMWVISPIILRQNSLLLPEVGHRTLDPQVAWIPREFMIHFYDTSSVKWRWTDVEKINEIPTA